MPAPTHCVLLFPCLLLLSQLQSARSRCPNLNLTHGAGLRRSAQEACNKFSAYSALRNFLAEDLNRPSGKSSRTLAQVHAQFLSTKHVVWSTRPANINGCRH